MPQSLSASMPAVFASRARIRTDEAGLPSIHDVQMFDRDVTSLSIAFRDGRLIEHYFHFVELVVGACLLIAACWPNAKVTALFFGRQQWHNYRQNNVQKHLVDALFPGARIFDIHQPAPNHAVENLLVIDRSRAGQFTTINKFLEPFLRLDLRHSRKIQENIWRAAGSNPSKTEPSQRLGYVIRTPPRTLSPAVEKDLLSVIPTDFRVTQLDFAKMTWFEQVAAVRSQDVLFGVHGNGLTNLAWMEPGSLVIELFPAGVHHYDYQVLCEVFGLRYFGFEGKSVGGYVYREFTRAGQAYGEHPEINGTITQLPLQFLSKLIRGT
jgi:hypothetical protein